MAKRFINPNWKALRQLNECLQRAWFYMWDQADESGVYEYDPDYLKLDLKLIDAIPLKELAKCPECEILPGERILIKNFISVNYKNLKPDYNPHKPAFRDIAKNKLELNSSLSQAYFKLEEEDTDKEEDKGKEEDFEKSEKLLVPEMLKTFKKFNKSYHAQIDKDYRALQLIAVFICDAQKIPYNPRDFTCMEKIFASWEIVCEFISKDDFFKTYNLILIEKHIQTIVQKIIHGTSKNGKAGVTKINGQQLNQAFDEFYKNR